MMELHYQQRTEAKIKWAVKCYNDWRAMRMTKIDCDLNIVEADINDVALLTKSNLEFALCRFICEVKKTRYEGDYPGRTLYQMTCCLQNHLRKKGVNWKLVHGEDFQNFHRVLDNVMQERSAQLLGTTRKQAEVISLKYENELWLKGSLERIPQTNCETPNYICWA